MVVGEGYNVRGEGGVMQLWGGISNNGTLNVMLLGGHSQEVFNSPVLPALFRKLIS